MVAYPVQSVSFGRLFSSYIFNFSFALQYFNYFGYIDISTLIRERSVTYFFYTHTKKTFCFKTKFRQASLYCDLTYKQNKVFESRKLGIKLKATFA